MEESSYEAVPYRGKVLPITAPNHLAICSRWWDGPHPPTQRFRVAELGCGDGANLLTLAFYHPESMFIGIDNSKTAIDQASDGARQLQLANIRFLLKDIRGLEPAEIDACDYILAHGLYSWVPEDAQEALLSFCRQCLTPSGVAYISYNAQPGWAMRRVVRETLLRARSVQEVAVEDKAKKAIEVATQLLEDMSSRNYAFAALLAEELERVRDGNPPLCLP